MARCNVVKLLFRTRYSVHPHQLKSIPFNSDGVILIKQLTINNIVHQIPVQPSQREHSAEPLWVAAMNSFLIKHQDAMKKTIFFFATGAVIHRRKNDAQRPFASNPKEPKFLAFESFPTQAIAWK